ncbi:MAG: hypothetical protein A2X86_02400 [Bdellovibrionales bacterium GWA2_49_15]|nr:MAG: hypothetical protein A2X86_02400 [Bdellovibrionales bacterium GWA2_49_15]
MKAAMILLVFLTTIVVASEGQNTRWEQLFLLVNEEIKTVETLGGKRGPDLEYRLFQLQSERLGLIKEKENASFLGATMADRGKRSKDSYFTESLKIYQQVKSFGLKIMADYPKHPETGPIFFTLATNSRDYGKDRMAEFYFLKALQHVSASSKLAHSIRVGLAEHYYNEKEFAKATAIYRKVVENDKDEWLAKHNYNLAWCQLKSKDFNSAIDNLILAFNLSRAGARPSNGVSYISVTDQVLVAMSIFYVLANRGMEGVQFFTREVAEPTTYLIKLAHSAAENGQFKEARFALTEALKKEKDAAKLAQTRLKELEIYRNFKQEDLFFEAAEAFWKLAKTAAIQNEQKDEFVDKTKSLAGQYQMELSKRFNHDKRINETQLARVLDFFKMIADVIPGEASAYAYYSGETLFILKRYERSAQYYEKAIHLQKEAAPDLVLLKKILNSFFAAISEDSFPKGEWRKMAYLGHEKLLTFYPKEEKAPSAYRELFALYVQDKRITEAEKLMHTYQLNFPKDLEIQKKQFLSILDHHIKYKAITEINRLIALMPKPPFLFALSETEKAMGILGNILFEQFIVLEKQNKQDEAARGLDALAHQEIFPAVVRAKAAYNGSLIYLSKMEGEKASRLAMTSLNLMPEKEHANYLPKFQKMTFLLAYGQFFDQAVKLGVQLFKVTPKNPQYVGMLQEMTIGMIEWNLSSHHFAEAEKLAAGEFNEKADQLIASTYRYLNYQTEYLQFVKKLVAQQHLSRMKQKREMLDHVLYLYLESFPANRPMQTMAVTILEESLVALASSPEIVSHFRQALTQQAQFEKLYAELQEPFKLELESYVAPFNQELFNRKLSEGLGRLKELTGKIELFLKNNNPRYAFYLTYQLATIYSGNAAKISALNPVGSPVEFQQAFQKEMKGLSRMIDEKGQSYFKSFKKLRASGFYAGNLTLNLEHSRAPASPMAELTVLVD